MLLNYAHAAGCMCVIGIWGFEKVSSYGSGHKQLTRAKRPGQIVFSRKRVFV